MPHAMCQAARLAVAAEACASGPYDYPRLPHFYARREGALVIIEGEDAAHLARSLRARPGETVSVVEPEGRLLTVRLKEVGARRVTGEVVAEREHRPEPRSRIWLGVAMLPAAALELVLSRCTEAGAAGFVLVQADRSVARGARPEWWARICREASMLAGRLTVPEVRPPMPLAAAWSEAVNPWGLEPNAPWRVADEKDSSEITLFVGPEGGWTDAEMELFGDRRLSLGPRTLRADTAALAALAVSLAIRGDL